MIQIAHFSGFLYTWKYMAFWQNAVRFIILYIKHIIIILQIYTNDNDSLLLLNFSPLDISYAPGFMNAAFISGSEGKKNPAL